MLLGKYRDGESVELLEKKREQLQGMMSALGLDDKGKGLADREF